jgi:rhodanese-related sulfurtransferase
MFHPSSIDQARQHIVRQLILDGAILLDVRTHCEHAGYHVSGAVNIPYDEMELLKDILLRWEKPVIVFSTYGRRSRIAAEKLNAWGKEVFDAGSMFLVENALRELQTAF